MLKIKDIKAAYQDRLVLDGISFEVKEGEFLGVIGPNGAGKTTLFKVLTGVKKPLEGQVMLDGKPLQQLKRKEIAKIMAVVPQSSFIPQLFIVEDVVLMGRYAHQKSRFFTTKKDLLIVEEALKKTETLDFKRRYINELSGGERQMVIIARSLAQEPKILLLDEPTANLDIRHQIQILNLAKYIVQNERITAILIIHDLNLAARFCQRLILLHNHKIYSEGSPREVITCQSLREVYHVDAVVEYNSIGNLQVVVKGIG